MNRPPGIKLPLRIEYDDPCDVTCHIRMEGSGILASGMIGINAQFIIDAITEKLEREASK